VDYKCLGKRIREERNKLRMTQNKLAEAINKSESFVGQIERGDSILSLETLVSIANVLGTNIDLLLTDSIKRSEGNTALDDEIELYLRRLSSTEKLFFLNTLKLFINEIKEID
jgi:transcriptional regulator with XRE-family HTH domain